MKTALHTLRLVFDQREEVEQRCGIRLRAHPRKQAPVAERQLGFVSPMPHKRERSNEVLFVHGVVPVRVDLS